MPCPSRMDLLPRRENRDVLCDAPRAGLRLLGLLDAVEDGVAVGAVQGGEELPRAIVGLELPAEVGGNRRRPLSLVGGLPAAVGLGALDLAQARGAHLALVDERGRLGAVD